MKFTSESPPIAAARTIQCKGQRVQVHPYINLVPACEIYDLYVVYRSNPSLLMVFKIEYPKLSNEGLDVNISIKWPADDNLQLPISNFAAGFCVPSTCLFFRDFHFARQALFRIANTQNLKVLALEQYGKKCSEPDDIKKGFTPCVFMLRRFGLDTQAFHSLTLLPTSLALANIENYGLSHDLLKRIKGKSLIGGDNCIRVHLTACISSNIWLYINMNASENMKNILALGARMATLSGIFVIDYGVEPNKDSTFEICTTTQSRKRGSVWFKRVVPEKTRLAQQVPKPARNWNRDDIGLPTHLTNMKITSHSCEDLGHWDGLISVFLIPNPPPPNSDIRFQGDFKWLQCIINQHSSL
ncbi:uncharacterized protein BDR25DRAFT_355451 [Lindgomyces ingoldianus]|uniref:Uncharacterized protein n=1 Tax=Lindgomyces ingoldianus TaxID=673940 RepID=A0ACB6QVM7_9PLEO|nr:uncharacterized protein BDR25DRAFT_355451 [Lindgomyces ingoldianus]KAF2470337.1 hypothetical protein BDR25DRAFT_355451 [Lindgomyces ingoldianus]